MTTIDFISTRGQQNFEDNAEINPTEIKIENDKSKICLKNIKKTLLTSLSKGYFFQVVLKTKQKKYL